MFSGSTSRLTAFVVFFFSLCSLNAQQLSSWMIGHVTHREANIWVQTDKPAKVALQLTTDLFDSRALTFESNTEGQHYPSSTLKATMLSPGQTYNASLLVNGKVEASFKLHTQKDWAYKQDPPPFKIALGSCSFINDSVYDRPGKPYGGNYEIYESIAQQSADLMIWLGDNTYLREADVTSRSGIFYRYAHTRALPEMQKLLQSTANYAIWDDHDFGPNDSDRSFLYKEDALDAFEHFWANPKTNETLGGISSSFVWNDVQIFLLDNRWNRTPNGIQTQTPTILVQAQLDWLIESMANSKASFKLVAMGGQLLNSAAIWENYINIAPEERQQILDRIDKEDIKNVIFLTGDRHHSAMSTLTLPGGNMVYDITTSPLSSKAHKKKETDDYLVEGSVIVERNFSVLDFSGEYGSRTMKVSYFGSTGEELFKFEIPQQAKD